jgi:hypothetical protein
MIKQLFCSLLLTTTAIHSMDLMLCNPNVGPHITQQLCGHRRYLWAFKDDIANLSLTNKALCSYYKNNAKNIVRMIARNKNSSDEKVARHLGQKTIYNKIKDLFSVIHHNQCFDPQDLLDRWYLTATREYPEESLLHSAIHRAQMTNIAMLTHAIDDINADSNANSLWSLFMSPLSFRESKFHNLKLFTIAQLLVQKGANPDDRPLITSFTPLMICILENKQNCAQLLLELDANPYALFFHTGYYPSQKPYSIEQAANQYSTDDILYRFDTQKPWLQNAFQQGNNESQKWFREMVKDINKRKKAKL